MKSVRLIYLLFILCGTGAAIPARGDVHAFRYELVTWAGDPKYGGELTNDIEKVQHRFDVEMDGQGRMLRVAAIQGGQKISEKFYQYQGAAKLPCGLQKFEAGEQVGSEEIFRNDDGTIKKLNFKSIQNSLTHYALIFYHTNRVEQIDYTPVGGEKQHHDCFYSEHGLLIQTISYLEGDKDLWGSMDIEENTGLEKSIAQFDREKFLRSQKFIHDGEGNMIRRDAFKASGEWLGTDTYSNNLVVKRIYQHPSRRSGKEIQYEYDEKRRLKSGKISMDGKIRCILSYDRFPDGAIKKTIARGPEGDLLAEYPDNTIMDVELDTGKATGQSKATIYQKNPW